MSSLEVFAVPLDTKATISTWFRAGFEGDKIQALSKPLYSISQMVRNDSSEQESRICNCVKVRSHTHIVAAWEEPHSL